jgi:pimeloyl-ACP methyl ester carboxylesterase
MAINGTSGHAFRSVAGSRLVGQVIPTLLRLVRAQAALVGRATRMVAGSDALVYAMRRVGLVSRQVDVELFRAVAGELQAVDWVIYSDLLTRLDEHDAEQVLPSIAVPLTIVAGDRDLVTPPAASERMHRAVPQSRLVVIRGGTHYTPAEYPGILVDELARLLDRVPGWERAATRRSA